MKRRRGLNAGTPSRDRWIIPYADFVTLLFACFAALYAATALDATTNNPPFDSAQGNPPAGTGILSGHQALVGSEHDNTQQVRDALERELATDLHERRLELIEDRRGLVLAIPEAFAFDAGRADLSSSSEALIGRVGRVLIGLPNAVRVEGHTDNTPIRNARFESNWDLSTARATRVVAYFVVNARIPPSRLSAAGYSEFHPRSANTTAEGRAKNRRVDIVILNLSTRTAEEPVAP